MKNISRTNLFMIELIIIIIFFSFASYVVINVFQTSNKLASDTDVLNGAVIRAESIAETYKAIEFYDLIEQGETLYYNENWIKVDTQDTSKYSIIVRLEVKMEEYGRMAYLYEDIYYTDKNKFGRDVIYSLKTKKFYAN